MEEENDRYQISIVDLAYEIINMHKTIQLQSYEIERLQKVEENYESLLKSSLQDSSRLTNYILKGLMNKTISPKIMGG